MKTITVKYFASLRETIGTSEQVVETMVSSVQDLRGELAALSANHAAALAHPRLCVAVNQAMVKLDTALQNDDEVAFFPPVTGG